MSAFRIKNTKYNSYKLNNKIKSTIDIKHNEKITDIEKKELNYNKLNDKINKYLKEIDNIDNNEIITNDDIEKKAKLRDKIDDLKYKIDILNYENDKMDYFYENIDLLKEYYSEVKEIQNTNDIRDLNDLFKIKKNNETNIKDNLYETYMKRVYKCNERKKINNIIKLCNNCKIEKTVHINEGLLICRNCGHSENALLDVEKSGIKDRNIENKPSMYKRINHLSELLNQFQAKESTDIDDDVYEQIKEELRRQRKLDYSKLNYDLMRQVLKKLRLNKFYEHIYHIINKLNGLPPPTLSKKLEFMIKQKFIEIQQPYLLFKKSNRKNFTTYNTMINKILQLLNENELRKHFPILKNRDKINEFDSIWYNICQYNGYKYIPTI